MRSKAINVNQMAGHCNITPLSAAVGGGCLQETFFGPTQSELRETELSNSVASSSQFALTMLSDCASEAMKECEVLPRVCGFTTAGPYD